MVKIPSQRWQFRPWKMAIASTVNEFERRYNTMLNLKKAELIEGIVYIPTALRFKSHGEPQGLQPFKICLADYSCCKH
ncbi:hypothetical protein [Leptothermofonsia sp. ETS-13]|uniref:hypothetical protein n=1 Tax=Leptothermofonsia sp. ETS-13 TaxID=3035696 RepID=UPI003BA27D1F